MTQIQLSDAQAVVLSAACAREDGMLFPVTASLKGGAVGNVCKSLLKHGLIEEVPATDLNTVWRHDEDRGPITLRATPLAYTVLGIGDASEPAAPSEPAPELLRRRNGTKQEMLITMLRAEGGATIDEIARPMAASVKKRARHPLRLRSNSRRSRYPRASETPTKTSPIARCSPSAASMPNSGNTASCVAVARP